LRNPPPQPASAPQLRISFSNDQRLEKALLMKNPMQADVAAALLEAQGVASTPEKAAAGAGFATLVLGNSAKAFAQLAFEEEPSGYAAALRKHAP
jgi:hypothetical protein